MRMRVDEAGQDCRVAEIQDVGAGRRPSRRYRADAITLDDNVAWADDAVAGEQAVGRKHDRHRSDARPLLRCGAQLAPDGSQHRADLVALADQPDAQERANVGRR